MQTKKHHSSLKSLIRCNNFKSFPQSGLLLLVEIVFKDGSTKHPILRRNYFSNDVLEEQKKDLGDLKNLPKEFSSEIREIKILDENIEIRVKDKIIKVFKNYSDSNIGTVAEEDNLEILIINFSKIFPDYSINIVKNNKDEISQAANRML